MLDNAAVSPSRIKILVPRLPQLSAYRAFLERIDSSRVYSNYGPLSREFTAKPSEHVGAPGVTLTSNGTTAIELALRSVTDARDEFCLMPAFTFIASAHAVCNARLEPYLADVDPASLMLTPEIAEATLRAMPRKPAAVLVVSAFGQPPEFEEWASFEQQTGIPVVFDAAAAITAVPGRIGKQPVCISLHATKVLGIGEGGAILSSNTSLSDRMTAMTGFGFAADERLSTIRGGNYRISEYACAVGLAALEGLPSRIETLRSLTRHYRDRFEGKAVKLQGGVGDEWVTTTLNVIVPGGDVEATLRRFEAASIDWRRWWGLGVHQHPAFAGVARADLSVTDALAPRVIGVPFYDDLSVAEVDRVVDQLS